MLLRRRGGLGGGCLVGGSRLVGWTVWESVAGVSSFLGGSGGFVERKGDVSLLQSGGFWHCEFVGVTVAFVLT